MKLTDELYEMGKNSKKICTIINDDYVLVTKSMPVEDKDLSAYIAGINKAKQEGINITDIIDYKMIPGTTSSYSNGTVNYTKGVFLEERAQGVSLDSDNIWLRINNEYDMSTIVISYLNKMSAYINELELRLSASQEVFDKLVSDCLKMEDYGLYIDPKPLNFFFNKDKGFTIIDVVDFHGSTKLIDEEFFATYIYSIVFGYGVPKLSIGFDTFYGLPQEYQDRLFRVTKGLEAKIVSALRKNGVSEEFIIKNVERNAYRQENKYYDISIDDMENKLCEEFSKLKEKSGTKNNVSNDGDGLVIFP